MRRYRSRPRCQLHAWHLLVFILSAVLGACISAIEFSTLQDVSTASSSDDRLITATTLTQATDSDPGASSRPHADADADPTSILPENHREGNTTFVRRDNRITDACSAATLRFGDVKASSLVLHFSDLRVPAHSLSIRDRSGMYTRSYSRIDNSSASGSDWSVAVPGKEAIMEYTPPLGCDPTTLTDFGVTVDQFVMTFANEVTSKESTCGQVDTAVNVICLAPSQPPTAGSDALKAVHDKDKLYQSARAVLRMRKTSANGQPEWCTGWLWGDRGHILTNEHCIHDAEDLARTQFEWGVECTRCDSDCKQADPELVLQGKEDVTFLQADRMADYALLQVRDLNRVARYGFLKLADASAPPRVGETIYVPQHPNSRPKKIALTDDDDDSREASIYSTEYVASFMVSDGVEAKTETMISYLADTAPGSSGSPVLRRRDHAVVGLHLFGVSCEERGNATANGALRSDLLVHKLAAIAAENNGLA